MYADVGPNDTARNHELQLEAQFFNHGVCKYRCQREADPDEPWTFVVSDSADVEQVLA